MIDLKRLRENPEELEMMLKKKNKDLDLSEIVGLDKMLRDLEQRANELKSYRNRVSKEIGVIKDEVERKKKINEMTEVSQTVKDMDVEIRILVEKLTNLVACLPNPPHDSVPVSDDENDKIIVRSFSENRQFDFEIKNHVDIGKQLGIFDFERGTKLSGSMFPLYVGDGARLEWALLNYFIDVLT